LFGYYLLDFPTKVSDSFTGSINADSAAVWQWLWSSGRRQWACNGDGSSW